MKPLFVLIISFILALIGIRLINTTYDWPFAGRIAMSIMLLFTAIAHFAFTKGMAMMIPGNIPYKAAIVYITGIIEIAAAIGLQVAAVRELTGVLLIIFFLLIIPTNIYAALRHIDYQKANYEGNGPRYLWFRVPLQVLFIVWVYCSVWLNS